MRLKPITNVSMSPQEIRSSFLQVVLPPCYIICQCLKFASPACTASGQSTQWEVFAEMSLCVYREAWGQVPIVTGSSLTVCPRLRLCVSVCLCLANYLSCVAVLSPLRAVYIVTLTARWSLVRWEATDGYIITKAGGEEGKRILQTGCDNKKVMERRQVIGGMDRQDKRQILSTNWVLCEAVVACLL